MNGAADLISLIYLSAATVPFPSEDLAELLAKSRANNAELGITGMLLFKDGYFLQLLEGDSESVRALYRRIVRDPRHRKAVVLSQATLTERDFPDWSMGFHDLRSGDIPKMPGFSALLNSTLMIADLPVDVGRAKKILLLFKEGKLLAKGNTAAEMLP
jgi:hypothetical protein